jgi:GT2 family glycosyltransferase
MKSTDISVVVLTYNRPDILEDNLKGLAVCLPELREIIVVDNSSDDVSGEMIGKLFPNFKYIKNEVNTGVAGRNRGMTMATGEVVVTLDDDVLGLGPADFETIADLFGEKPRLGALCFRVLHFETGEICNWCHHREREKDGLGHFVTYEITEGAVAYRRSALTEAGYYFEGFFISHEGKDLAYRLMNKNYAVEYDGRICVTHCHAIAGRTNWRRYYYDTRNSIWLATRNMPFWYGTRFLALALLSMGVYSLRDGFLKYWFKAVWDGLKGLPEIRKNRNPWEKHTGQKIRNIDRLRPSFWYKLKGRLFRREVQI